MRQNMFRINLTTCAFMALMALCSCRGDVPPPVLPKEPPKTGPVPSDVKPAEGLSELDRTSFYHLSEGSEFYPLAFLLALKDQRTGQPFLKGAVRFGLIPYEVSGQNPYGLPIGVTVAQAPDTGIQMVGVNCAACHVGQIEAEGKRVVIDGAPNMFDLQAFFSELAYSTKETVTDLDELLQFIQRVNGLYKPTQLDSTWSLAAGQQNAFAAGSTASERTLIAPFSNEDDAQAVNVIAVFKTLEGMKKAGDAEKKLAEVIEQTHKEELKREPEELYKSRFKKQKKALTGFIEAVGKTDPEKIIEFGGELDNTSIDVDASGFTSAQILTLGRSDFADTSPLGRIDDESARAASVIGTIDNFVRTIRLLRARAKFLLRLAGEGYDGTVPGHGRVDAFGGARNLVFPNHGRDLTAPICWPHLWGIKNISWYHWDGSTTSLLERNVGQAIGLGAIYDPASFESSIDIKNIEALENIARRIQPPRWPFSPPDSNLVKNGKAVFARLCSSCHTTTLSGDEKLPDVVHPVAKVKTDPRKVENFAYPIDSKPFDQAVSEVLKKLIISNGGTTSADNLWRVLPEESRGYVVRPLVGVWATAPYLHNGSVPTLYHLLLPQHERPEEFRLGHRDYDINKIGYITSLAGKPANYRTRDIGNGNNGHSGPEFGTDMSKDDRSALLEYLKTL